MKFPGLNFQPEFVTYQKLRLSIDKFLKEEEAATAVEYAVILMLIAGALISTLQLMGGSTAAFLAIQYRPGRTSAK